MSDLGDTFKAWNDDKKSKKQSNKVFSTELVKSMFFVTEKNAGNHLIIEHEGKTADFWPSTGKYCIRGGSYKRGVNNLISDLTK